MADAELLDRLRNFEAFLGPKIVDVLMRQALSHKPYEMHLVPRMPLNIFHCDVLSIASVPYQTQESSARFDFPPDGPAFHFVAQWIVVDRATIEGSSREDRRRPQFGLCFWDDVNRTFLPGETLMLSPWAVSS